MASIMEEDTSSSAQDQNCEVDCDKSIEATRHPLLDESKRSAEILFFKVARKTLSSVAASCLRQLLGARLRKVGSERKTPLLVCDEDIKIVYKFTATFGTTWMEQVLTDETEENNEENTPTTSARTYALAIKRAVDIGKYFDARYLEKEVVAKLSHKTLTVEGKEKTKTFEYNDHLERLIVDPCNLQREALRWLNMSGNHCEREKELNGRLMPFGGGPYGLPSVQMYNPVESHNDLVEYNLQKLERKVKSGNTNWYGPQNWSMVKRFNKLVSGRSISMNRKFFTKEQDEFEVVPRSIADKFESIDSSNSESIVDVIEKSIKSGIFRPSDIKLLKKKGGLQNEKLNTRKEIFKEKIMSGRDPSSIGQEETWQMNEILEEIDGTEFGKRVENAMLHRLVDEDDVFNRFQGGLKSLGQIHVWEHADTEDEAEKIPFEQARKERLGGKKLCTKRKAKDLSPSDQTSKVMRTEAIDVEFLEVDMGGCIVELTNEDGTDKDLHAFRSIEMSLFQR